MVEFQISNFHVQVAMRITGCVSCSFVVAIGMLEFSIPPKADVYLFCHWLAEASLHIIAGFGGLYVTTRACRTLSPTLVAVMYLYLCCLILGEDVSDDISRLSGSKLWSIGRNAAGAFAVLSALVSVPAILQDKSEDEECSPEERKGLLGAGCAEINSVDVYGNAPLCKPQGFWNSIAGHVPSPAP